MNRFYCLKITLKDTHRPVWRRFVVPANIRLDDFHNAIQTIMGWDNGHLHAFETGNARREGKSYKASEHIDEDGWNDSLPEEKYTLKSLISEKGAKSDTCTISEMVGITKFCWKIPIMTIPTNLLRFFASKEWEPARQKIAVALAVLKIFVKQ